jgi:arylsulfatase
MFQSRSRRLAALLAGLAVFVPQSALAQAKAPPLGSPQATRSIPNTQIPAEPVPFGGVITQDAMTSTPFWQPQVVPPAGAPNVLLILLDDAGYASNSTFGGVIPTPNLDRLARMGLRYTNFNSTALCSPSRAALLTGRNHHSMGFGVVAEQSTGFPGYDGFMTPDKATVGKTLSGNGYLTSWFGKNHNTPTYVISPVGPFSQWPTAGMGFNYFYGFMGGETSQWTPGNLYRNTDLISPYLGNPQWNLMTAMADDAILHIRELNAIAPDRPFFMYYAPGATHAPHHPTQEWVDKITAMHLFDEGWNKLRERIFANQKRLGVLPPNAKLSPWPKELLKEWDQLTPEEKKLFIRQANVYAAYLAYADHEVGRVIAEIERQGKLDNTLIIFVTGDNGGSAEGTPTGTPNEYTAFNGIDVPIADQMKFYDAWGSDLTYPHMAVGWTWAFDTPYKWTKQIPNYFGGIRQGMVMVWPNRIKDAGGIRHQFHHFIDIAPTILEAANIKAPLTVDGIAQAPIEGVSMAYTWNPANRNAPSTRTTQYFEMFGVQGLYNDGWMAASVVSRPPWDVLSPPTDPTKVKWELYDLSKDPSQTEDVAARYPEKLTELKAIFAREAARYNVFPLDSSVATRFVVDRPNPTAGRTDFTFEGPMAGFSSAASPNLLNTSYRITATVDVPAGGAKGVMVAQGGIPGGYTMFLDSAGKPVFTWNLLSLGYERWEGPTALPPGRHQVEFDFAYTGMGDGTLAFGSIEGLGRSGTGTLKVNGQVVATKVMERTIPIILPVDESFDVGSDLGSAVDHTRYTSPYDFTGTLVSVNIKLDRPELTASQKAALEKALAAKQASD